MASSICSAEKRGHHRVLGSHAAGRAEGGEVHVALTDPTAGQIRRIKNEIVEVQSVQEIEKCYEKYKVFLSKPKQKIITTTHLLKVSIKSTKTFSYLIS